MKSTDYLKLLRAKTPQQLSEELATLRQERFNVHLQQVTGRLNKPHRVGEVRARIARVQTVLKQQEKSS
ncbi:MAG: 50S ribosomal protein L29 [Nevskiales bacterium]|nr:50S ribosomal protein L29 [Nevskiales bacterium]